MTRDPGCDFDHPAWPPTVRSAAMCSTGPRAEIGRPRRGREAVRVSSDRPQRPDRPRATHATVITTTAPVLDHCAPWRSSTPPMIAPMKMKVIVAIRRPAFVGRPPISTTSAARPPRVVVSTVVFHVWEPMRRTTAFCTPIDSPSRPPRRNAHHRTVVGRPAWATAPSSTNHSSANPAPNRGGRPRRPATAPPATAPATKAPRATSVPVNDR